MTKKITTFLMFDGKAEEAINFYASIFENTKIENIDRYGPGEAGTEGSVKQAKLVLDDLELLFSDSTEKHDFDFTPSISHFIECSSKNEIEFLYEKLSSDGKELMPIDDYGFSSLFGWVTDKFGVSWQLNLA